MGLLEDKAYNMMRKMMEEEGIDPGELNQRLEKVVDMSEDLEPVLMGMESSAEEFREDVGNLREDVNNLNDNLEQFNENSDQMVEALNNMADSMRKVQGIVEKVEDQDQGLLEQESEDSEPTF